MIAVDLPDEQGQVKTKVVWYLLYYVRYLGGDLSAQPQKDEFGNEVYQPAPTAGRTPGDLCPALPYTVQLWANATNRSLFHKPSR